MHERREILRLIPLLAGIACGAPSGLTFQASSSDFVVVQGVLTTTGPTQAIWIEHSRSVDSVLTTAPQPLDPAPRRVEVRDTLGGVFPFAADAENPARFTADFIPGPGRRYDLFVEAGERRVTGTVVVPLPIALVEPAGDTVRVPPGDSLRVRWTSGASRHFAWTASPLDSALWGRAPAREFTHDTVAALPGFIFGRSSVLWVLAMDAATWAYFHSPLGPEQRVILGNLVGGAGVFGAMTAARIVVYGS
jgi:hypothetical protein